MSAEKPEPGEDPAGPDPENQHLENQDVESQVPADRDPKDPKDPKDEDPEEPAEPEWWQDPRMPWAHKPTRQDIACFTWISVFGIYALAILPFRAVLITMPYLAASLTGSRTGVVMIGALTATGVDTNWPFWLLVATLSVMKFDWIYFWAGRLWGRGVFEMVAGKSPRARRNAERAESVARRFAVPAIFLTYLPIPLPAAVIYATLGAAGMTWKRFLGANAIFAAIVQSLYFYLGYRIGEPAVQVVTEYGKYAWYLTLAILAGMIVAWWWRKRRKGNTDSTESEDSTERGAETAPAAEQRSAE